jgi:RNA polymerase sigma-70 factor (ECF subfamily)
MEELNDIALKSAISGNMKEFRKLYDHYSSFVWKVLYRTVNGNEDDTKQIMQNVFIKVHRVLRLFKFNAAFSTWLYRITYNEALSYLNRRKKQRKKVVEYDDSIGNTDKIEHYENKDMVTNILNKITPKERFLLVAREVNNVPFEELAEITGQTSGALRTQLHRIKESIKKSFQSIEQYS